MGHELLKTLTKQILSGAVTQITSNSQTCKITHLASKIGIVIHHNILFSFKVIVNLWYSSFTSFHILQVKIVLGSIHFH